MLDWDIVWRALLLSVVFLADVVVFFDLAKEEWRDLRGQRPASKPRSPVTTRGLRVFRKSPSPR
jgi:hypothetical protein